ncbi:MAG: hypothetical protein JXA10_01400 [Anaerolineae bacterium]|nr:hypothetical protein [Anaerolineae bacterium]
MSEQTRVWWDGNPVQFIRWTDKGLVFNWDDPRETAIHMPRGTVMRLMAKGVLEIEGDAPDWTQSDYQPVARLEPPPRPVNDPPLANVQPELPQPAPPKVPNKLNIIARLINKLGGGDPVRAAG